MDEDPAVGWYCPSALGLALPGAPEWDCEERMGRGIPGGSVQFLLEQLHERQNSKTTQTQSLETALGALDLHSV